MRTKTSNGRVLLPLVVGGVAAATAAVAMYAKVVRPWHLRWGASDQEVKRALPGDALAPNPRLCYTRAITINAPVDQVWQWVVQIGQNRGGLYSYEWLENLVGADMRNAEFVMPKYQHLEPGDYILLYPNGPAFGVAEVQAPRALVLQTVNFDTGEFTESVSRDGIHGTWAFVLERRVDNTTRLLVRARMGYEPSLSAKLLWGVIEPVNFVMERKMLQGIKERAESHRIPDELLDRVMPEYEFRGIESILVHATPEQILTAFDQIKGSDMPLAELLGQIRSLPERFAKAKPAQPPQEEPFSETMRKMGFVELGQEPNREMVVGAIAKFHELADQQFVPVRDADEFRRFLHEDYQKLAISVRVTGQDPVQGCTLTLEHRTHALSEHARKQFARYWIAIKPGGGFVTKQMLAAVKAKAEALAQSPRIADTRAPREPVMPPAPFKSKQTSMPKPELVAE